MRSIWRGNVVLKIRISDCFKKSGDKIYPKNAKKEWAGELTFIEKDYFP